MAAPRRRVVDTSAWIEWLTGSALGKALGKQFPARPQCIVPTIVQLELSKWLVREVGEEQADEVIAYTQKCEVVPLDTTIALVAADLHREHKLATADAIVYATAQHHRAELLTCDAHFEGLPDIVFVPKLP
jgi:predicted nucleic acid-binding protein